MRLIKKISRMRDYSKKIKGTRVIGFVPTMGSLHEGHLSLIRKARQQCEEVMISIFVNPTQFGKGEDYQRYPRDLSKDMKLSEKEGVDVIFAPSREEMYPQGYSTFVEIKGNLSSTLEGASRPGHFKGVATILTKLFNIINPDYSYFGEKDYQQALVVKKLVKELNLDTRILVLPTIRGKDGLALSSRNSYLNKKERTAATIFYKVLKRAKEWVGEGEKDPSALVSKMRALIEKEPLVRIDYVAVVNPKTLEKVKEVRGEVLALLAVNIGETRLIDNIKLADS
ncbi:pantoate--beta-alanine ligase [Candidatus Aerophobetes bacterium]|nr:pantoate--beta-alanine ligase [Candidatus Aerophobetes bacterium]